MVVLLVSLARRAYHFQQLASSSTSFHECRTYYLKSGATFDYKELNIIDGEAHQNHSEAMQLVILTTNVLPKSINDLDDFYKKLRLSRVQNTAVSFSQSAQVAGIFAGAPPLRAITSIFAQSSNRDEVANQLASKQLLTVRQLPDLFELSEESLEIEIEKEHKIHDILVQKLAVQLDIEAVDLDLVSGGMLRIATTLDGQSIVLCSSLDQSPVKRSYLIFTARVVPSTRVLS